MARFKAERGPVILITNAPRPNGPIVEQLDSLGVPREAWSRVVTSGDATRELLRQRVPGPVYKIGPERDWPLYHDIDLKEAELVYAAFISVTGPFDDENDQPGIVRPAVGVDEASRVAGLERRSRRMLLQVERGRGGEVIAPGEVVI